MFTSTKINVMWDEIQKLKKNSGGGGSTSSAYNIGLEESPTHKKYLEKDVFVKIFSGGTHTTTQGGVVELMDLPDGIDKIFSCRVMIDNQNQVIFSADVPAWVNNGKINIVAPVSTSTSIFWCILEYTKPDPVPEATKKTKRSKKEEDKT